MTPEYHQRIEQLLDEALDLHASERAGFLATACDGNPQLRAEVEALLSHYEQAAHDGFLETPLVGPSSKAEQPVLAAPLGSTTRTIRAPEPIALSAERTAPPPKLTSAWPTVPGYEIVAELGRGGMGVVYQARQTSLRREVALKMVLAADQATPESLARMRAEAEAVAQLQHPNIVQIHEVGEHEGRPFFAMEFVGGGTLAQKLAGAPQPARQAASLVETLARAVNHVHQRGIVHRDLKPANVLLTTEGVPKITDFGLAKLLGEEGTGRTRSGDILGTPSYMAPEQAGGKPKEVGSAADVYALGAILYELLTGRPPFRGETPLETLLQVRSEEPVSPSRLQPKLPRDLVTICLKCLEKEPRRRYPNALALAEDLHRFGAGKPITARPIRSIERVVKWAKRRPAIAALLGTVVLVASIGFGGVIWEWLKAESALARAETNQHFHNLALAYSAWSNNDIIRADQFLEACPANRRQWEWWYLKRLCHSELRTLHKPAGPATSPAYAPLGMSFGGVSAPWTGDTMVCSPSGPYIASTSGNRLTNDGTVTIWDMTTGQVVRTLPGRGPPVLTLAFSPDGLRLAAGGIETIDIWDTSSGKRVLSIPRAGYHIFSIAFSPDGQRFASGGWDHYVSIWDAITGKRIKPLYHRSTVMKVTFSPDGRFLASAVWGGTVRIWDARTYEQLHQLHQLQEHSKEARALAFSPDSRFLASAGWDKTIKIWDTATGKRKHLLEGHSATVWGVCFSPDGQHLASAGAEGCAKIWDLAKDRELLTLRGHSGALWEVAFGPEGRRLITGGSDGTVKVWDVTAEQEAISLFGYDDYNISVALSLDGRRFAMGHETELRVWDTETGEKIHTFKVPGSTRVTVTSLVLSPDGEQLAVASSERVVKWWDLKTGSEILIRGRYKTILGVVFSPDNQHLRVISADGGLRIWDAGTGTELLTLPQDVDKIRCFVFSRDGRRLAFGDADGIVKIWDAETGNGLGTLPGHTSEVISVAFSKEGDQLAAGARDGTLKIWNVVTRRETVPLRGHTQSIAGVAFSPNGKRLVSAGEDLTLKLWDTDTGHLALTLRGPSQKILSVAFSPDGQRLLATDWSATLTIWNAQVPDEDAKAAILYGASARAHAKLRQFKQAATDYDRALALEPSNVDVAYRCAIAHLAAGDEAGYRTKCTDMVREFGKTELPGVASNLLYACVPLPGTIPDKEQMLTLARIAVGVTFPGNERVLGAAHYRTGNYHEAVLQFEIAKKKRTLRAWDFIFLAMAHERIGHASEARRYLAEATLWIDLAEQEAKEEGAPRWYNWLERVEVQAMRREADTLLSP